MARTNIGATFSIAGTGTTPSNQNSNLNLAGFGALTWIEVPGVGNIGDTGVDQNMVSYPVWGSALSVQTKGAATGAQAELRVLDLPSNGMTALKAAASITNLNNFAFRILWPDGRVEYNRGVVGSPSYTKGANEDFAEAVFTIALNQEPVFGP